jgi:cysteine desulfurase/selenocysteine lyase
MVEQITSYQGGGEMIKDVSFEKQPTEEPHKFEAGTPNIAGGIALGTAVDYMNEVGFDNIQQQENELYLPMEQHVY